MRGPMGLKPKQKRRLAAEQALYHKFDTITECNEECNRYCRTHALDITFNKVSVQQYIGCQTNLSLKRLKILAAVLGVTNYPELDEIFTAPEVRGAGLYWEGDLGHKIPDINMNSLR